MDERVRSTIRHLELEGLRAASMRELAMRAGVSASRLAHLFKKETGLSIRAWIVRRRLSRAAELMLTTDQRVSEILYAVGFTDFSNFDHSFKQVFSVSPREYRRRWRESAVTEANPT